MLNIIPIILLKTQLISTSLLFLKRQISTYIKKKQKKNGSWGGTTAVFNYEHKRPHKTPNCRENYWPDDKDGKQRRPKQGVR